MSRKWMFKAIKFLSILSFLLVGCSFYQEISFSEIDVGEQFYGNRDGYSLKIPYNYCLCVELTSKTGVFKVPDELLDVPYAGDEKHDAVYNCNRIIEGHYVKGYYNNEYLVLCEEKEKNEFSYLALNLLNEEITCFFSENEVYEVFNFNSKDWFVLCNTYDEIQD